MHRILIFVVPFAVACGGDDGTSTSTSGGGMTASTGGTEPQPGRSGTTGGGSTDDKMAGTTGGGGTTGGTPSCVAESATFATDLPYRGSGSYVDQDCTSKTADQCLTGNCVEWSDTGGMHGKCFVYCSELRSQPTVGQACSAFATCLRFKNADICVPNALNLCAAAATTGGGGTSGSSCVANGGACFGFAECCSNNCQNDICVD
jgi:hypothetical protein